MGKADDPLTLWDLLRPPTLNELIGERDPRLPIREGRARGVLYRGWEILLAEPLEREVDGAKRAIAGHDIPGEYAVQAGDRMFPYDPPDNLFEQFISLPTLDSSSTTIRRVEREEMRSFLERFGPLVDSFYLRESALQRYEKLPELDPAKQGEDYRDAYGTESDAKFGSQYRNAWVDTTPPQPEDVPYEYDFSGPLAKVRGIAESARAGEKLVQQGDVAAGHERIRDACLQALDLYREVPERSLLEVIVRQALAALFSGRFPRPCRECGQWFRPPVRLDAIYCSKKCRDRVGSRNYRRKRANNEEGV